MSQRALAHVALLGELDLLTGSMFAVAEALATLMPDDASKVAASNARIREALLARPDPVDLKERWIREILGRLQHTDYVSRDYDPLRHRMPVWRFPGMIETGNPQDVRIRQLLLTLQRTQSARLRHRAQQTHMRVVQQHNAALEQATRLARQREVS